MRQVKQIVSMVATAALLVGVGATGAGAAAGGSQRSHGLHAAPSATATGRMVTLVTGDHVRIGEQPGGRTEDTFLPAAGHPAQYSAFHLLGQSYLLPRDALSGLGRQWVLADFDLTRFASGRAAPAVRSGGSGSYTDVLSRPAASPARSAGGYHLKVLTLNGINDAGQPDDFDSAILVNVDNSELYAAFLFFDGRPIKLQVPVGHYAVIGTFFGNSSAAGSFPPVETVVVPQVTVDQATTVAVDARAATQPITVSLPAPTRNLGATFTVIRTSVKGGSFTDSVSTSGNEPLLVNAVPTGPTIGGLQSSAQWHEVATKGDSTYDVFFPSEAIPSDESFTATSAGLAAVHTTYASDGPARHGLIATFSFTPDSFFSFALDYPLVRPLTRVEYYSTGTGVAWSHSVDTSNPFSRTDVEFGDSLQSFHPGTSHDAWLTGPLVPAVPVASTGVAPALSTFYCQLCRTAHSLDLDIYQRGDTTPGHVGTAFGIDHTAFTLSRGDVRIASGAYIAGSFPVPSTPAVYRLSFDDVRTTPAWLRSTSTSTSWTFPSAAGAPDLPSHWRCPDNTRNCSLLSLLFPRYVLPTDLLSQERAGPTGFVLGFDHDDTASKVPVGEVHVSVSFDGGHSWTAATVRALPGHRSLVSYTNPAPDGSGVDASLRVSAVDGSGSTVTQTVLNAYAVANGA